MIARVLAFVYCQELVAARQRAHVLFQNGLVCVLGVAADGEGVGGFGLVGVFEPFPDLIISWHFQAAAGGGDSAGESHEREDGGNRDLHSSS